MSELHASILHLAYELEQAQWEMHIIKARLELEISALRQSDGAPFGHAWDAHKLAWLDEKTGAKWES